MNSNKVIVRCLVLLAFIYGSQCSLIQPDPAIELVSVQQHAYIERKPYVQIVAFLDLRCGTCFVFLNIWHALAVYFQDIRQYVHIQMADCARERLGCLGFNISVVPAIRYFPPNYGPGGFGIALEPGANLFTNVHGIFQLLKEDVKRGILYIPPQIFQNLLNKPIREPQCCQIPDYEKNKTFYPTQAPPHVSSYRPLPPQAGECLTVPQKHFPANTRVQMLTRMNVFSLFPQDRPTFIGLYDAVCRPCTRFIDVWDLIASNYANFSSIFAIDCGADQALCDQYNTNYYPNVRYIAPRSLANSVGIPILTDMTYRGLTADIDRILRNPIK
ncbi:hypothetical protein Trydic_g14767 [Trypoxylus dichotomus]